MPPRTQGRPFVWRCTTLQDGDMMQKINNAITQDCIADRLADLNVCAVELKRVFNKQLTPTIAENLDTRYLGMEDYDVVREMEESMQGLTRLRIRDCHLLFEFIAMNMEWFQRNHNMPGEPSNNDAILHQLSLERSLEIQRNKFLKYIKNSANENRDLGRNFAEIMMYTSDKYFAKYRAYELPPEEADPPGTEYKTPTEQMQSFLSRLKDYVNDERKTVQIKLVAASMVARDFTTRWSMDHIKNFEDPEDRLVEIMKVIIPKLVMDVKGKGKGKGGSSSSSA